MKIYQVDSFSNKAFSGNPAGVCLFTNNVTDQWMQNMASEMNLSETAFLYKENDGYNLRWFTPAEEVDLCGHATLASAHILWSEGYEHEEKELIFYTKSGVLKANKYKGMIELDFPAEVDNEVEVPEELIKCLNINPLYVGKNRIDYIVEVEDESIVKNISPDFELLKSITTRGVIVTSKSKDKKYDFISRFFAPGCGINEDPVTGSAHCCLAPYWMRKMNKSVFNAYQSSKRGGEINVEVVDDRVLIRGEAVTVFSGDIL